MEIIIWGICIIVFGILLGEYQYKNLHKNRVSRRENIERTAGKEWKDSVDYDIELLELETVSYDMIPHHMIERRGSWRIAQNQMIDLRKFQEERNIEYSKML